MALYTNHTDEQLVTLLKDSDEAAFTVLFERYRDKLFYYLLKHTKSAEVAEEIVMDIFMKLWVGRELVAQIPEIGAFFFKVGYYKSMDFLRTAARHRALGQAYIDRLVLQPAERGDEILVDQEMRRVIREAIAQLSPQRNLIYRLSREEGLTHDQIAEALNLSRNTVKNSIMEATRSIAGTLRAYNVGKAALSTLFFLC